MEQHERAVIINTHLEKRGVKEWGRASLIVQEVGCSQATAQVATRFPSTRPKNHAQVLRCIRDGIGHGLMDLNQSMSQISMPKS